MDTNNLSSNVSRSTAVTTTTRSRSRRRWLALLAIPIGGALSMSIARAHGFGGGHEGGPMGPHMQERIDHLLGVAGASDGQKAQVKAIWDNLRPQLQAVRKQDGDLRRQMGEALAGATIDPARVEQLRKKSVESMDRISALMTQGMVASAQVLSPEQRKIVLQKIEERRRHFER